MGNFAIKAENLSKSFRISHLSQSLELHDALERLIRTPARLVTNLFSNSQSATQVTRLPAYETLWALKEIAFEIKHGEVVGFIGHNGAGKSVALKILANIMKPTKGLAQIYGRVGAILEVGTGFHPELTGRENIYLNGAILGMKNHEIKLKFEEIVDFSGVERFLDMPVKRYSSGMRVRLAFAVAAHLEPEVLLFDEILAVGDNAFEKKCIDKMKALAKSGRTLIFVSHKMASVENLCTRALLFQQGKIIMDGSCPDVITHYSSLPNPNGKANSKDE